MARHTAKRIFDRLKVERGYTMVKEAVTKWKATTKEVFAPLSHPPGEVEVDSGFAYVDVAGERQQVALFVMSLPYSDAVCIQAFPREGTEAGERQLPVAGAVRHQPMQRPGEPRHAQRTITVVATVDHVKLEP